MFKNDWILDMVESFGRNLGKAMTDEKDDAERIIIENLSDKDILLIILKRMISDKKYNEAENILFDFTKSNKENDILEIGEWLYNELSLKDDDELAKNNFLRYEIEQGLRDFKKIFEL
jgi:hypothetical protein